MATIPPASKDMDIGSGTLVGITAANADPLTKAIPITIAASVKMSFKCVSNSKLVFAESLGSLLLTSSNYRCTDQTRAEHHRAHWFGRLYGRKGGGRPDESNCESQD